MFTNKIHVFVRVMCFRYEMDTGKGIRY